ncbi:hypothetical protein OESDEN_00994 [Oesophagostomum dentatum]|uniref:Uncharacterized protein n=1 Tax=Oesophagostomum dentatum TaxID=61180 RepID=A0A0B1TUA3_OESDE|nr:hypothetical protein OESDEN_00994 [Oesophagostomum dentatum]
MFNFSRWILKISDSACNSEAKRALALKSCGTKTVDDVEIESRELLGSLPLEKANPPSSPRDYENTIDMPRFFEPENFRDAPMAVCYTYNSLDMALELTQKDAKVGFSVVSTVEGTEINHVSAGEV